MILAVSSLDSQTAPERRMPVYEKLPMLNAMYRQIKPSPPSGRKVFLAAKVTFNASPGNIKFGPIRAADENARAGGGQWIGAGGLVLPSQEDAPNVRQIVTWNTGED